MRDNLLPPAREVLADKRPEHERVLDVAVKRMLRAELNPAQIDELRAMVEHPDPRSN